ncbi:MAG: acetate--CoA ligase [Candidatus Carbobacillus altaicus]|nr:acetate--CoA ligase [Candidatus Carbobacillus altaicus]
MQTLTVEEGVELLQKKASDPALYWADIANELEWFTPWLQTVEGDIQNFRYFVGGLTNVSYNCLDRHLPHHRNKVALFYEREDGFQEVWTYQRLYDETNRLAAALSRLGLKKGDRLAIYMTNTPEVFAAIHAAYRLGVIYTVMFAGFSKEAIESRLRDFEPHVVITADGTLRRGKIVPMKATLDQALEHLPKIRKVIVKRRLAADIPWLTRDLDYDALLREERGKVEPVAMEANEPGFVIYTSGTTAQPKGLVHSGVGFLVGTYANVKWSLDIKPEDVYWCTADVGWLTFPIFALIGGLAHAATLVVYEGAPDYPDPGRFYAILERYRVNKVFTAPTLLRMLRRAGDEWIRGTDDLVLIALVGEPLDPDTYAWTRDQLGGGRIFVNNTYGQTETGTAWASSIVGLTPTAPGSCGHALPGYEARVVDEKGEILPPGQLGYLVLTKPFPSLARTVWGNHERYLELYFSQIEGAYFSGDAAEIDAFGQLWVRSRVDDVINVSGHRIGTMELEAALINHPAVSEAAVIGEPDPVKGEVPVAFVILRKGYEDSAEMESALIEQVEKALGSYARPKAVHIVPTLPRTRSGKIMRRLLKELMQKGEMSGDITTLDNPESIEVLKTYRASLPE